MLGIIIALLLGYWIGKNEKKEQKQIHKECTCSVKCGRADYGYIRQGESVEDLI